MGDEGRCPHKKFLNDFFTGRIPESFSRGVLYNETHPATGDARFCGTTASMCGVEKAGFCHDRQAMEEAVRLDTMLHAFMLFQSGIPVLYSGDEVGQVNDYTYKDNPEKSTGLPVYTQGRISMGSGGTDK